MTQMKFEGSDNYALCLVEISAPTAPLTLLITDIVWNQAYKSGSSLEDFARRDLALHRKKAPSAQFTPFKLLRFRPGLDGYRFGMRNGNREEVTFYFALGPNRYSATCRGDVEKDCLAALATLRSQKEGAAKSEVQGSRVTPKSLGGVSVVLPPGWLIMQDTPRFFTMLNEGALFQLRTPVVPAMVSDDRLASTVQDQIKSYCHDGLPRTATRTITSKKYRLGMLTYATCRTSTQEHLLSGVLSVGSERLFLSSSMQQDPTARTLEILSSFETPR